MQKKSTCLLLVAIVTMLLLSGCGKRVVPPMERPMGTLAVAGFTHPKYDWQLLAGYVSQQGRDMDHEVLMQLDQALESTLDAHGVQSYIPPVNTRKCQEIITFRHEGERVSALTYWTEVGRCMKVDWLLVPQVLSWRDRSGSDWGVTESAAVALDFYYIDVAAGEAAVRRHFEDTQLPLSEDLGHTKTYFKRGGTWVPALRLAQEGLDIKLTEMGL